MAQTAFGRFMDATREQRLMTTEELINDAQSTNFSAFNLFYDEKKSMSGGNSLVVTLKLVRAGGFGWYDPGQRMSTTAQRTTRKAKVPWAFGRNAQSWAESEVDLNYGNEAAWMNLKRQIEADAFEAHVEGLAEALFSPPVDRMELDGGNADEPKPCNSVPLFVVENAVESAPNAPNGLVPVTGGFSAGTVETLNPTNEPNWRNHNTKYDASKFDDPVEGVAAAFDRAFIRTNIRPPRVNRAGAFNTGRPKSAILTNGDGKARWQASTRAAQDHYRNGPNNPGYDAEYRGIEIVHEAQLDVALLDQSAGAATNQPYPKDRPRYYVLDLNHIYLAYHPKHMLTGKYFASSFEQPDTEHMLYKSYVQLVCTSRRRQCLVSPQ